MRNRVAAGLIALVACIPAAAAGAEQVRVLALGDSLTQGYGLPTEDGFVPQLESWLRDRGHDVEVINAGVSGDTTAGGLSRVDWSLTPEVDAMIVALGGNDLLRGIDPAVSRANLRGILEAGAGRDLPLLLVGLSAPGNYGPEFKRDFDAMYVELAEAFDAALVPNMFDPIAEAARDTAQAEFMQPDMIHPNARGVAEIVEVLGPHVVDLIARVPQG